MRAVLVAALLAAVAFAGCTDTGTSQSNTFDVKEIDLKQYAGRWDCSVSITGPDGIFLDVTECGFTTSKSTQKADLDCFDLKGHHKGTSYGNFESTVTVAIYTPGGFQHSETRSYDIERGDSASARCNYDFQLDEYGTYSIVFTPKCYKDSNKYWPGLQEKEVACSFEDTAKVKKEGFF